MRINPKEELFGHPVLVVREVVRMAMRKQLSCLEKEDIYNLVAEKTSLPIADGRFLLEQLIGANYLTLTHHKGHFSDYWLVEETEQGRQFGVTRANPPISRVKAEELLRELLERVKVVNSREDLVYVVSEVGLFGSYLTDAQELGDLDVAITLQLKEGITSDSEPYEERIALARRSGRVFRNFVEEMFWPREEVLRELRTRKKGLSIHIVGDDPIFERVTPEVVYRIKS